MPNKPVNIKTQTVLIFFWVFNIFTYYRIGKLRRWLLDSAISFAIAIVTAIIGEIIGKWLVSDYSFDQKIVQDVSIGITLFDWYVLQTYLAARKVRKWSREWNEKIKSN